jgi:hypothetical protein
MTPCGSRYGQMPRTAAARCPREPASADSVSLPRARRGREATPPRALIRPAPRSPHARERVAPRSALADRPGTTPTQIRPQLTGHHRTSSGASSTPESAETNGASPQPNESCSNLTFEQNLTHPSHLWMPKVPSAHKAVGARLSTQATHHWPPAYGPNRWSADLNTYASALWDQSSASAAYRFIVPRWPAG